MSGPTAPLLTTAEAAAYLRISKRKLYNLGLPKVKLGHSVRWRQCDLDAYVEQHIVYPVQAVQRERRIPRRKALLDMEGLSLWEKAQRLRVLNESAEEEKTRAPESVSPNNKPRRKGGP
jgi:excisionase family DNA binding protein